MVTTGVLALALIVLFIVLARRIAKLQTELKTAREMLAARDSQLRESKSADPLTRALTARKLREKADGEIHRAIRYGMALSVIVCDIDHLQQINQSHDRDMGDRVLRVFADTMLKGLRETDWFGRWEEDDFIALLPETHLETAIEAANRLKELLDEALRDFQERGGVFFSVSMGIAQFSGQHESFKDIYKTAQEALVQAKANGTGGIGY